MKTLRRHEKVRFVFNGHFLGSAHTVGKGNEGNAVHQMLSNYQDMEEGRKRLSPTGQVRPFKPQRLGQDLLAVPRLVPDRPLKRVHARKRRPRLAPCPRKSPLPSWADRGR